ncbi:hypothetical protein SAMN02745823_00086 [Sporobacter termitidis DSM 10068]|uniref:Activator of Hsp90 ATPase homolog 1-like protein n=1 Tax=Sporobacter termitidis DSM 10068 TaxID=1123282 RepID=A0A1M5TGW1_9FIRM|nr:hypothetical protein [Sporobacter termitidis]SHH49890.1 hypothetical protein SAMN02745823_00086 [Sporobacter termitidis DSM 10068]
MSSLTVTTMVEAPIVSVWDYWNKPEHIVSWYSAQNSRRPLNAAGIFSEIEFLKKLSFKLSDDKTVFISFSGNNCNTVVTGTFELADVNPEKQRDICQSILDQFKKYAESNYGCC